MGTTVSMLFVLLLAVTASTSPSNVNDILDGMLDKPMKEIFKSFHYLYKKNYELNSQEALSRYRIFKINNEWIKNENEKLGKKIYGITEFSDLTHEEFIENYLMKPGQFEENLEELTEETRFLSETIYHEHNHVHHHYNFNTDLLSKMILIQLSKKKTNQQCTL